MFIFLALLLSPCFHCCCFPLFFFSTNRNKSGWFKASKWTKKYEHVGVQVRHVLHYIECCALFLLFSTLMCRGARVNKIKTLFFHLLFFFLLFSCFQSNHSSSEKTDKGLKKEAIWQREFAFFFFFFAVLLGRLSPHLLLFILVVCTLSVFVLVRLLWASRWLDLGMACSCTWAISCMTTRMRFRQA